MIHAVDHLVAPVAVEIVDLEAHVVGQMIFPGVGRAELPELPAVERKRRQTTQLAVAVLGSMMYDLAHEHVDRTVAVEVAEAKVPPHAETFGLDLLPDDRLRIRRLEPGQFLFLGAPPLFVALQFGGRSAHAHQGVLRRHVRQQGDLACAESRIVGNQFHAGQPGADPRPLDGHACLEPAARFPRAPCPRQHDLVGYVESSLMAHPFQHRFFARHAEEIVRAVVAIAKGQTASSPVAFRREANRHRIVGPQRVAGDEHGVSVLRAVLIGLVDRGITVAATYFPGQLRGCVGRKTGNRPGTLGAGLG